MAQRLAAHQAGYLTACTLAAILPLDLPRSAPVQLALQGQVQRRRQLCGNCWQLVGQLGPVLPLTAVAATDQLLQVPLVIHQADGHAIDLGLNPQLIALGHPARDSTLVWQLTQACVSHWMRLRAGAAGQRVNCRAMGGREAAAPMLQGDAGLVIQLVCDRALPQAMVGIVPFGQLSAQGIQFAFGARGGPVGAGGPKGAAEQQQAGNSEVHRERPCSADGSLRLVGFTRVSAMCRQ